MRNLNYFKNLLWNQLPSFNRTWYKSLSKGIASFSNEGLHSFQREDKACRPLGELYLAKAHIVEMALNIMIINQLSAIPNSTEKRGFKVISLKNTPKVKFSSFSWFCLISTFGLDPGYMV
jgi:hypothetical protein